MLSKLTLVHFVFTAVFLINKSGETIEKSTKQTSIYAVGGNDDRVLPRKRRYLTFPEGASFQLVFCLTYTSVAVGSYFVFGHTAAIAWQLPSEPLFFSQKDFQKKEDERGETTTTEVPLGTDFGKISHESWALPHGKVDEQAQERTSLVSSYDHHKGNQETFQNRRYDKKSHMRLDMDPKYHQVHRRTRRELYMKIENFLTRLNLDGKACLLKSICEVHKLSHEKGELLEEMFKAIFRARARDKQRDEDEYDVAANLEHNCDEVYRACSGSIRNVHLLIRK